MSATQPPEDQAINLLTALQTVYSEKSDPVMYLSQADEKIAAVEQAIIETCSKHRIRIDDNLYALLDARDTIAEQKLDIDSATGTAEEITNSVNQAVATLSEKMRIRENLDAALAVASQTRKLTRMYARIEDTIDSNRLYTAFCMLRVLEEETRCVKAGTILQELVPDCHRLRSGIVLHARKSFHAWLVSVRKSEVALGAYALYHENKLAAGRQNVVTLSGVRQNEDFSRGYGAAAAKLQIDAAKERARARPWSPLLTAHPVKASGGWMQQSRHVARAFSSQQGVGGRSPGKGAGKSVAGPEGHFTRSFSSQRIGVMSPVNSGLGGPEGSFRPEIGGDGRGSSMRSFASEYKDDIPMLHLRPLLQSVLVNDGLELLGDMRADYRRERHAHLKKIVDEMDGVGEQRGGLPARESAHQMGSARAREIETFVFRVCGFFVVERSVEMHARPRLLARAVVDFEWWNMGFQRVQGLLKEQEDAAVHSPADKAWSRSLLSNLDRFAQANRLVS